MSDASDGEYDVFLDALADGRGYYYTCSNGHGTVPPRRVCPHCGDRDLERIPLPETGEIRTYSTVNVPTPAFDDDAPYVTAIASFGPIRLTGIVRGTDPTDVEIGTPVAATVEPRETTDERTVTFRPDESTRT
ncbi:Zn-ribbon domain-containing OB-fold protein [Natrinema longum]|uniref:Zn-ribbon domain-containing OB-fold protein n=1 Tax=Natrinema longum TaxID=370324 RepID=UPI001CC9FF11|nr:Zn-ribbon domain-containing OB-fold protein [Natrinema longum]MBZ6497004.1 Zn-ribbon domain-containing OB-fold protein [Natrinema longum]